jgi:hypothetical protein
MAAPSLRERLARLFRRRPRRERIDPFTIHEPWRRFVQEALKARSRFDATVDRTPKGPLHDRLREIADRIDTAVGETWQIAKRGDRLVAARRQIDVADLDRRLGELGETEGDGGASSPDEAPGAGGADVVGGAVARSLRSRRATVARMDAVIDRTRSELRVLDARLDESVARAIELTARAGADASLVVGLGDDIDDLVTELEALRLALDDADAASRAGAAPRPSRPPGGRA